MKKYLLIIILCVVATLHTNAQKFGVRAGWNFATIQGPQDKGETFDFNSGVLFGINYSYLFNDVVSLRAEIGYSQFGYKYKYSGEGFYIIRTSKKTTFEKGKLDIDLENSNGYISLPIVANVRLTDKFEVNAGIYANLLVSPTGQGILRFESSEHPKEIVFRQSLDYAYFRDRIGYLQGGQNGTYNIGIYVDNEVVNLKKIAGAYYQYAENLGRFMNRVDFGLTGGVDYFIRKGFFVGVNVSYGLLDVTNNAVDYRRGNLSDNNAFIFDNHKDTHFGINASVGFRF